MDVIKWDISMAHRCFERATKTYATTYSKLRGKKAASKKSSQAGEWDDFKSGINKGIAKKRR